mmetsp:Transcript_23306/g.57187  ORF Transcript_23306/g.57187 Transcript_23306/m.57187 type:complete len:108 (+) Transcript_23306:333-656(+)|eukprot:CAMPEP_0197594948 /NCGR_PEP_ID=MMETSP1326-20131121/21789_1 /TAXON_ID=1155430 /ORGANISM="Genus nov. species nov., Strain RCC2288" /LENGTH=107 /DNA_ID=CAMNT_0043161221 /DNA_START=305 /DNA_END=628 /DNA_ORIENTATION=-
MSGGEVSGEESSPAATSAVLFSVHKHLQARCATRSAAFLSCKKNNANPAACIQEGTAVTGCMLDLLKELKGKCPVTLNKYAECMDYRSNQFPKCRVEQAAFEKECPL